MENSKITRAFLYFLQKPPEAATRELPALSELVPIINDQSQYISHLEAEVKFCKVLDNVFHLLKNPGLLNMKSCFKNNLYLVLRLIVVMTKSESNAIQ